MDVKRVTAHANEKQEYVLIIGLGLEKEFLEIVEKEGRGRRLAIITDSSVEQILGKRLMETLKRSGKEAELLSFAQGEQNKNQKTVTELQEELLKRRYGRDTLIIALGGGVVGDVAGFVAATFLRGVPYINVPTTLLAMVDSSIGGKVGVDTEYGKNTIGAFWLPRAVIMDLKFLEDLPRLQIVSGLLEAVKTFLTSDKNDLASALKLDLDEPLQTAEVLQKIVHASVKFKVGVTDRDIRESNERRVLNFGHTIGHAIELLSEYKMPHGYCVGHGILVEARIAEFSGVLPPEDREEVFRSLAKLGILPADFPKYPVSEILKATKGDKKTRGGVPYYVLLESVGSVYKKDGQFAHPVSDDIVEKALKSVIQ